MKYHAEPDDRRPRRRPHFICPYCGSDEIPATKSKVSAVGWVVAVVLLLSLFCLPLFWMGFLIREPYRECRSCGIRVGG